MRYFRRNSFLLGEQREEGIIKSEHEFFSNFKGNEFWEEVIVTPKPQPKKYKKEVALFQIGSSMVACEAGDYISTNYSFNRITDWALVEFVEKT